MALVSLQTNFRDPRFQRALLEERASRPYAALPVTGAATRAFVGQDLDTRLRLANVGLESRLNRSRIKHQRFRLDMQKRMLKDREQQLPMQIGVGMFTAGIGGLMGMREKRRVQELSALKSQQHEAQMDLLRQIAAQGRT